MAEYIETRGALADLAARLSGKPRLALDTEFVGEDSYTPRLELVQISDGEEIALVDFRALRDLGPLGPLFLDPAVEIVLHAGSQDIAILTNLLGATPPNVFDTQIAAAMIGYGAQIAYGVLALRAVGQTLQKGEAFSNWGQRPLSPAQIAYAADDVRHLLPVADHLRERLVEMGRLDWALEEMRLAFAPERFKAPDDRERFRRVKDRNKLSRRAMGVLMELAAWRESEARRRDVPRVRIVGDEMLVEMARTTPRNLDALRGMRRAGPALADRYGRAILEAVQQGLAIPENELPRDTAPARRDLPAGVVDILQAVVQAKAEEAQLSSTLLATSADLHALVEGFLSNHLDDLPVLQGWRQTLVGTALLDLLAGRASVSIAPRTLRLQLTSGPDAGVL